MPHQQPLFSVLGDANVKEMEIPIFQREYSWKVKEAHQLFEDIKDTADSRRNSLLGLLVFISTSEQETHQNKIQIVDGQQRCTTLSLLLAIVRSEIADLNDQLPSQGMTIWGQVDTIGKCLFRDSNTSRTTLLKFHSTTKEHAELFTGLLLTKYDLADIGWSTPLTSQKMQSLKNHLDSASSTHEGKIAWLNDRSNFSRTAKSKNVYKNYLALHKDLKEHITNGCSPQERLDRLKHLTEIILNRLTVIKYETSDIEEAFFLFETLNDRGMAVAGSDLIKNFCILHDSNKIDEIGALWGEIFKDVLTDNVQPMYFLRTFYNSRYEFVTKKDVFHSFRSIIRENNYDPSTWLRTQILPDARRFRIMTNEYASITETDLHNIIFTLNQTNSTQWQTITLSAIRLLDDVQRATPVRRSIEELLMAVLKSALLLEAKSLRGSILEKELPFIAKRIKELEINNAIPAIVEGISNITAKFKSYCRDNELNTNGSLQDLISDTHWDNTSVRPFLAFMRLKDAEQGTRLGKLTVEHVYPKNPDDVSDWSEWTTHDPAVEGLKLIGNFLALSSETNSSVNNSKYEIKKNEYIRVNVTDFVEPNSSIHWRNVDRWTPEVVHKRSQLIAERLLAQLTL